MYHHGVRREIYREALKTFSDLILACQNAVGLVCQMESPAQPSSLGLASVTHPARSPSAPTLSRPATSLKEMGLGVEEEVDEGFVEPMTISQ